MNSKSLRRLAADHGALHAQPLPPNYLWPSNAADQGDDLTQLDVLLAGPSHTPFSAGVWKLHLTIPSQYPQAPPTAHFRTPIFHPNVDAQSGGVCVETLKRDWDAKLTLRDVLVTICCLLIQPNPDSALNAEAGALIQEGYEVFARRAKLMTSINAAIPRLLLDATTEAQMRGQEHAHAPEQHTEEERIVIGQGETAAQGESSTRQPAPIRRRRTVARLRHTAAGRRSEGSPSGAPARRRFQPPAGPSRPSAPQPAHDDVFGLSIPEDPFEAPTPAYHSDSQSEADQENDSMMISPVKARTPKFATPRRPQGTAVPLGELTLEDPSETPSIHSSEDEDMSPEYPPSPRKSPSKSPVKRRLAPLFADIPRPEKGRMFTPPNLISKPLAESSPFVRRAEKQRKVDLEARLWDLCGGDVGRWNRGDFDGGHFVMKAARW